MRVYARRISMAAGLTALVGTVVLTGPTAQAAPPAPVDAATARAYAEALTVQAEGSLDGYSRTQFPHWITQHGACNTREVVLQRDGQDIEQDEKCAAVSGTWKSPYDGATWEDASDIDIDHVVPLAEAWRSGANKWTKADRQKFANDLSRSQLIAVTDRVNQAKGDKDPAKWMPPLKGYACTYARMWVTVKHDYKLSADTAEKDKLVDILAGC
ncbi:HNH endonuclease [Streptomyces sp. AV19]|uniref:HNH endonuclease family protein n=1 Tax=Streptomyces sp. AV19 TaxID=2793068 RepID=UPI0018FEEDBD|nr:HNH endonuclease family protein [Streptomyces sp. AV19]MBH1937968.1 HNH endonuclease [Streptomyces sp. AV19]MDG4536584.1 HNH endonuclease family protein [Streptomyces sp. AV19]